MNHHDIANILDSNERVTSTYADIYYENEYCNINNLQNNRKHLEKNPLKYQSINHHHYEDKWVSPSDLLIDVIELKPPFTSKIFRGQAHEGLLGIGNNVLESERKQFLISMKKILSDNDASWEFILKNELKAIKKRVKSKYENIFKQKSDIMNKEILKFYKKSLKELESHVKCEVETFLKSTYAKIMCDAYIEINEKLKKERATLEKNLNNKLVAEVKKIKDYYKLILENELERYNQLRNNILVQKNDAIKSYYKQMEAEKVTSVMYVLSFEKKKCRIKKMLLEKYQSAEISDKIQKLKERKVLLHVLKEKEVGVSTLNEQWEAKIKKIVQLFLKFISFSLKLLPEQSTFLLHLENMVILQLNEIQKNPNVSNSILIEDTNIFKFQETEVKSSVCAKEPFVIIGDLSIPEPPRYGSTETLPSDVDLPFFRLKRQYIYAKCHGYEGIKQILNQQKCKCHQPPPVHSSPEIESLKQDLQETTVTTLNSDSSDESIKVNEFHPYRECPLIKCGNWSQRFTFPFLASYLDFSEENYKRVKTILPFDLEQYEAPEILNPKDIAKSEVPFSVTKEFSRSVETQYSSEDEIETGQLSCPCIPDNYQSKQGMYQSLQKIQSENLNEILNKRKISLNRMLADHPKLLELLSDEKYDFKM